MANDTARRPLSVSSLDRIAYEENAAAEKAARLATLKVGSPACSRCKASLEKTIAFVAELKQKREDRLERQARMAAAPKVHVKNVKFSVEIGDDEPANDQEQEHVAQAS